MAKATEEAGKKPNAYKIAVIPGDGVQEVLANGPNANGRDGMWYLDLRTGAKESHVSVGSGWQVLRGPIAGNLDGKGGLLLEERSHGVGEGLTGGVVEVGGQLDHRTTATEFTMSASLPWPAGTVRNRPTGRTLSR